MKFHEIPGTLQNRWGFGGFSKAMEFHAIAWNLETLQNRRVFLGKHSFQGAVQPLAPPWARALDTCPHNTPTRYQRFSAEKVCVPIKNAGEKMASK